MKLILELVFIVFIAIGCNAAVIYGLDQQAEADQRMISNWLSDSGCSTDSECEGAK